MSVVPARKLTETPALDGVPNRVADFRFLLPGTKGIQPTEGGEGWIGWNDAGFHLAARLEDAEVVPGPARDEELHFLSGDTLELFLKPVARPEYWEMYATPPGRKTTLFFRAPRDQPQPDPLTEHDFRGLRVASRVTAGGWESEMWVPVEQLAAPGNGWGMGSEWSFLVGRYNHGAHFPKPELSVFPAISAVNFHLTGEYARIDFRE